MPYKSQYSYPMVMVEAASGWMLALWRAFAAAFADHSLLYGAAFVMALAAFAVSLWVGAGLSVGFQGGLVFTLLYTILAMALAWKLVRLFFKERSKRPARDLILWVRDHLADVQFLANGLHALLIFAIFATAFSILKARITDFVPFYLDEELAALDRFVHFGFHPWQLLHPIFGHPLMTWLLNAVYSAWFLIVMSFYAGFGFQRQATALRHQYLLATILCWGVAGNLSAMLLSSAGPCYYGLTGLSPDPFAPLMAYLKKADESVGIMALQVQTMLWTDYANGTKSLGISAMPSMHVASSMLFFLAGRQIHPLLGRLMGLFLLLIFLGSIHLGWHYALDGYAGMAAALASWHIAGRLPAWLNRSGARKAPVVREG